MSASDRAIGNAIRKVEAEFKRSIEASRLLTSYSGYRKKMERGVQASPILRQAFAEGKIKIVKEADDLPCIMFSSKK